MIKRVPINKMLYGEICDRLCLSLTSPNGKVREFIQDSTWSGLFYPLCLAMKIKILENLDGT